MRQTRIINLLLFLLPLDCLRPVLATSVGQATNFNVTPAVAEKYGCNSFCQNITAIANDADLEDVGVDFDFDFYNTANNFSSSKPGDLLKIGPINSTQLSVPAGVASYRFQYTSEDIDGSYLPVTGFIALPFTLPYATKKFPMVAFAHGTIGVYRGCAPSTSPSLFDYDTWTTLIERGYAIVATDYAGLGNNYTKHRYVNFAAHANDIYYSVVAARKAFGHILTHEWVSVGHSQGGGAVWKLSEYSEVQDPLSGYLGTVAISAPSKIYDMSLWAWDNILHNADFHEWVFTAEIPSFAAAIKTLFPQYDLSFLGGAIKSRLALTEIAQSCTNAMMGMTLDLTLDQLINSSALFENEYLKHYQDINAPANGASASKPMMLVHGLSDTSVIPQVTVKSFEDTCRYGNEVHLRLYPGLDHSATPVASAPEWIRWIDSLFKGEQYLPNGEKYRTIGKCTNVTRTPIDLENAKRPVELDLNSL